MIQKPKGTYDVYKEYGNKFLYLEKIIKVLMENFNYDYIRTPIFESKELFHRGVGETTDIVSKETYDFKDRGDRMMTLRPEGTAGVVRSFIENKFYGDPNQPFKVWYYGPIFRYEQPQSGRFREHYQFGVEVLGSTDPMLDAEIISIPVTLYQLIGLKGIKVNINSLGDS
jgi:histidyl-tRNA synthetase